METATQTQVISHYSRIGDLDVQKFTNNQSVNIYIYDVDMYKASGYGQYKYQVQLHINDDKFTYSKHTTDSRAWDDIQDLKHDGEFKTSDHILDIFNEVMEHNSEQFLEDIQQCIWDEQDRNED